MTADGPKSAEHPRIQRICLDLMYGQTRSAWVSNAFCMVLLWFAFWENVDKSWFLGWSVIATLLMALRDLQARRYLRLIEQPVNLPAWTRWLHVSLFINGCLWGICCASLALIATPYQLPVILLIAGGLQTGSVLSSSYLLSAFALFSIPLFLCTLVALLVLGFGGHFALLVTAGLLMVWSLFILMCAARFGKHYRRSVGYSLENHDLAQSLTLRNRENETLNQTLQKRIVELNDTQRSLLAEKSRSDGLDRQLTELSTTDGLTHLGNRRFFDNHLQSECRRAMRNDQPIALVLMDVDHFKAYNDHYGHLKGDDCLVKVADVLADAARREGDWAARYGGEEFALILANTSLEDALQVAEAVRYRIVTLGVEHTASPTALCVTLSAGVVAAMPNKPLDPKVLIAGADEALYKAKRAGRNRVVAGNDLPLDAQKSASG